MEGYQGKVDLHWGSHAGAADLFAAPGTPVLAARGGTVVDAGFSAVGGNNVTIRGDDGLEYYYAHLIDTPEVKKGQTIPAGARLGGVGDTGNAKGTGAHLHFGAGKGIATGTGPAGGAGVDYDTVAALRSALSAPVEAPAARQHTIGPNGETTMEYIPGLDPGPEAARPIPNYDPSRPVRTQTMEYIQPLQGRPQTFDEAAAYVSQIALQQGLGEEGAKAAVAILKTEGGWQGKPNLGDAARTGSAQGTSEGGFQLNFAPGNPGTQFAKARSMTNEQAIAHLRENPLAATEWALGGYLGNAIQEGLKQGLTGPALATYAQTHGQRSIKPETAGANYAALFGAGQPLPATSPAPTTAPSITSPSAAPTSATSAPSALDQAFEAATARLEGRYGGLLPRQTALAGSRPRTPVEAPPPTFLPEPTGGSLLERAKAQVDATMAGRRVVPPPAPEPAAVAPQPELIEGIPRSQLESYDQPYTGPATPPDYDPRTAMMGLGAGGLAPEVPAPAPMPEPVPPEAPVPAPAPLPAPPPYVDPRAMMGLGAGGLTPEPGITPEPEPPAPPPAPVVQGAVGGSWAPAEEKPGWQRGLDVAGAVGETVGSLGLNVPARAATSAEQAAEQLKRAEGGNYEVALRNLVDQYGAESPQALEFEDSHNRLVRQIEGNPNFWVTAEQDPNLQKHLNMIQAAALPLTAAAAPAIGGRLGLAAVTSGVAGVGAPLAVQAAGGDAEAQANASLIGQIAPFGPGAAKAVVTHAPEVGRAVVQGARTVSDAVRQPSFGEGVARLASAFGDQPAGALSQSLLDNPQFARSLAESGDAINDGPEFARALTGVSDPEANFFTIAHRSPIDGLMSVNPAYAGTREGGLPDPKFAKKMTGATTSWDVLNDGNRQLAAGFGDNVYLAQVPRRAVKIVETAADLPSPEEAINLLDTQHLVGALARDTGELKLWIQTPVIPAKVDDFAPQSLADLQRVAASQAHELGAVSAANLPFKTEEGKYSKLAVARNELTDWRQAHPGEDPPEAVLRKLARGVFEDLGETPTTMAELRRRVGVMQEIAPEALQFYPEYGNFFLRETESEPQRNLLADLFGLTAWSIGPVQNMRATIAAFRIAKRLDAEGRLTEANWMKEMTQAVGPRKRGGLGLTVNQDQVGGIWKLLHEGFYAGGDISTKAPTYRTSVLQGADLFGERLPVNDRWHFRALGMTKPAARNPLTGKKIPSSKSSGEKALARRAVQNYSNAVTAEIARDLGLDPTEVQSALWWYEQVAAKKKPFTRQSYEQIGSSLKDALAAVGPEELAGFRQDIKDLQGRIPGQLPGPVPLGHPLPGRGAETQLTRYSTKGGPMWRLLPGDEAGGAGPGANALAGAVRGGIAGGVGASQEEGATPGDIAKGAALGGLQGGVTRAGGRNFVPAALRGLRGRQGRPSLGYDELEPPPRPMSAEHAAVEAAPSPMGEGTAATGKGLQGARENLVGTLRDVGEQKAATATEELVSQFEASLQRHGVDPAAVAPQRAIAGVTGALGGATAGDQGEEDDDQRTAKILGLAGLGLATGAVGGPVLARRLQPALRNNPALRALGQVGDAVQLLPETARPVVTGLRDNLRIVDQLATLEAKAAETEAKGAGFSAKEATEYAKQAFDASRAALTQEAKSSAVTDLLADGATAAPLAKGAAPNERWVKGADVGEAYAGMQFAPEAAFILKKLEQTTKPNVIDYSVAAWKNSLLTGPPGRIRDALSSLYSVGVAPIETAAAGAIDLPLTGARRAAQAIRGQPVTAQRSVRLEEAPAMVQGQIAALPTAFRDMMKMLRYGYSELPVRADVEKATGEVLPGALNLPGRMVGATDVFFKGLSRNASVYGQSVVKAKAEGLKGQEYVDRVAYLREHPTADMLERANKEANYRAFQSPSVVGDWLSTQKNRGDLIGLGANAAVPFHSTALALTKYALERSPAGLATLGLDVAGVNVPGLKRVAPGARAGQREVAEGLARVGMGSALMYEGWNLAQSDNLTGAAPKDPKERDAFYRQGKQPFSIQIGGEWRSYAGYPIAPLLGAAVSARDAVKNGEADSAQAIWLAGSVAAAQSMADQQWFSGLQQLSDALSDDTGRGWERLAESYARSAVPGAMQTLARSTDNIMRDPDNPLQAMMSVTPGLSGMVRGRTDSFGNPVTRPDEQMGLGVLRPDRPAPAKAPDVVETELARLQSRDFSVQPGGVLSSISIGGSDVGLTPDQRAQYKQAAGKLAYGMLAQQMASPEWAQKSDAAKEHTIKSVYESAHTIARNQLRQAEPSLVEQAKEQIRQRRERGAAA